jgi:hypothetical protein
MKRNAYADSTIKATAKRLKHLQKNCDLTQPEEVKAFIANKECSNAFKECLIETYDFLLRSIGIEWDARAKTLRLKVYSLGTGTREGTHINPNKE